jgi:hypothetical protein
MTDALDRLHSDRVARGVCRHCGGPTPCWSMFGDQRPGKRHTDESYAAYAAERQWHDEGRDVEPSGAVDEASGTVHSDADPGL